MELTMTEYDIWEFKLTKPDMATKNKSGDY